jgi:hypothetical protein
MMTVSRKMSGLGRLLRVAVRWPAQAVWVLLSALSASAITQAAPPDLSGVWQPHFGPMVLQQGPRPSSGPPYLPEFRKTYEQKLALVKAGKLDLGGLCTPPGMPQISSSIGRLEVINAPAGRLTVLYEYQSQIRRIYLNARHPADVDPTMNGDSIAHWEGNTLVVHTIAIKDLAYLDANQGPHSDALEVEERIHLTKPGTMQIDYKVTDPVALKEPWTYSRTFDHVPNGKLIDYYCNENPRNPVREDGSLGYTFKTTPR